MFPIFQRRRISNISALLSQQYLDARAVFMHLFDALPCSALIAQVDTDAAFRLIREQCSVDIQTVLQQSYFSKEDEALVFNISLIILRGNRLIEVGAGFAEILHTPVHYGWARQLVNDLAPLRLQVEPPMQETQPVTILGFARRVHEN